MQHRSSLTAAVIGVGMAGCDLARQLKARPDVRVVAGVDVDQGRATEFCGAFGGRPFGDVGEMARTCAPDFVVVASTNDAHADNVVDAIEAGVRNVYCEKPLAIQLSDAVRMTDVAERGGVRTSVGFAGLEAGTARMLEVVGSGRLGRLLHINYETHRGYGFWGQERINRRGVRGHHAAVARPDVSGGWTLHHACHQVYVLTMIGGPVRSVGGTLLASTPQTPSEEVVSATLLFEDGAVATLLDSVGSFRGMRCVLIGTRGTLVLTDEMGKAPGSRAELRLRVEGADADEVWHIPYKPQMRTRLIEFVDAVHDGAPSPIPFRTALENLRICHSIRAAAEGQRAARSIDGDVDTLHKPMPAQRRAPALDTPYPPAAVCR